MHFNKQIRGKLTLKTIRNMLVYVLIVVCMISLIGCSTGESNNAKDNEDVSTDGKIVIGLSMNTLNNPFFVAVTEGAKKAAEENNIELIVTDAQNSPSNQMKDVENLIQKKPKLIIIDPADSDAIVSAIELANENDIPVITIDRASNGGEVVSHIGFDAIYSGSIAGNFLIEELEGKGNIVEIMGIMGTNVAQDRSKGFNQTIAEKPDMKIIAQQSANFDRAEAMKVMENILQANPKIDGVYAANDEMALGALEAIEASGRLNDIVLIGCDAIDPAIEAIKSGKLDATIAEPPFFLGKSAVTTALKHLSGEVVEERVILNSTLVTKENVDTIKTKE